MRRPSVTVRLSQSGSKKSATVSAKSGKHSKSVTVLIRK